MSAKAFDDKERVIWQQYPSWKHFSWLYLFAAWTGLRGLLLRRMDLDGWEMWMGGVCLLLALVVVLRYWAWYLMTDQRIIVKNGYTGNDLDSMNVNCIKRVDIRQGLMANWLGIGTLVVYERDADRRMYFRGVKNPEVVCAKLKGLLPTPLDSPCGV